MIHLVDQEYFLREKICSKFLRMTRLTQPHKSPLLLKFTKKRLPQNSAEQGLVKTCVQVIKINLKFQTNDLIKKYLGPLLACYSTCSSMEEHCQDWGQVNSSSEFNRLLTRAREVEKVSRRMVTSIGMTTTNLYQVDLSLRVVNAIY